MFKVGDSVRVKASVSTPRFGWGSVNHSHVGVIKSIQDSDTVRVDFPVQSNWRAAAEELELVTGGREQGQFKVGDKVRVKPSVSNPKYSWGSVTHASVGVVTAIDGKDLTVDFPEQSGWTALASEMELVGGSENVSFQKGDIVRVKRSVGKPKYDWGKITHASTGEVVRMNNKDIIVNFPEHPGWSGLAAEMELVETQQNGNNNSTNNNNKVSPSSPKPCNKKKNDIVPIVKPERTTVTCPSSKNGQLLVGVPAELVLTIGKDAPFHSEPLGLIVNGPLLPNPMEIVDNDDGTLSLIFTSRCVGHYEFEMNWGGVPLKDSPYQVDVVECIPNDASKVTIEPNPITGGNIDKPVTFHIISPPTAGNGPVLVNHVSGPVDPVKIECTASSAGKHLVNVTYPKPGTYKLSVTWGGKDTPIPGSPFEIKIE